MKCAASDLRVPLSAASGSSLSNAEMEKRPAYWLNSNLLFDLNYLLSGGRGIRGNRGTCCLELEIAYTVLPSNPNILVFKQTSSQTNCDYSSHLQSARCRRLEAWSLVCSGGALLNMNDTDCTTVRRRRMCMLISTQLLFTNQKSLNMAIANKKSETAKLKSRTRVGREPHSAAIIQQLDANSGSALASRLTVSKGHTRGLPQIRNANVSTRNSTIRVIHGSNVNEAV